MSFETKVVKAINTFIISCSGLNAWLKKNPEHNAICFLISTKT